MVSLIKLGQNGFPSKNWSLFIDRIQIRVTIDPPADVGASFCEEPVARELKAEPQPASTRALIPGFFRFLNPSIIQYFRSDRAPLIKVVFSHICRKVLFQPI